MYGTISEVRVSLVDDPNNQRLLAFCTVTFDGCMVLRGVKVISGHTGTFISFPSRKMTDRCPHCGDSNHLRARFCNDCGGVLGDNRSTKDEQGKALLFSEIIHPIDNRYRTYLQNEVLSAYYAELNRHRAEQAAATVSECADAVVAALTTTPQEPRE